MGSLFWIRTTKKINHFLTKLTNKLNPLLHLSFSTWRLFEVFWEKLKRCFPFFSWLTPLDWFLVRWTEGQWNLVSINRLEKKELMPHACFCPLYPMAALVFHVCKVQVVIPQICRIFTNNRNVRNQLSSKCDRNTAKVQTSNCYLHRCPLCK